MKENPTYEEAIRELEEIVTALEQGEVEIDRLHAYVERAAFLLGHCRKMLKTVEKNVLEVLDRIDTEGEAGEESDKASTPF